MPLPTLSGTERSDRAKEAIAPSTKNRMTGESRVERISVMRYSY